MKYWDRLVAVGCIVGVLGALSCGDLSSECSAVSDDYACDKADGIQVSISFDGEPVVPKRGRMGIGCGDLLTTDCLLENTVSGFGFGLEFGFDTDMLPLGETSEYCGYHSFAIGVRISDDREVTVGDEFSLPLPQGEGSSWASINAMNGSDDGPCGFSIAPEAEYRVTSGFLRIVKAGADGWKVEWRMVLELTSDPAPGVPATIELNDGVESCAVVHPQEC